MPEEWPWTPMGKGLLVLESSMKIEVTAQTIISQEDISD